MIPPIAPSELGFQGRGTFGIAFRLLLQFLDWDRVGRVVLVVGVTGTDDVGAAGDGLR
ncbi:hypothetical protein NOGI109294_09510 [Nocardiopsis gilva]